MTAEETESRPLLKRRATRRAVLGGTLAAGSVAVAYAALGDKLGLFAGGGDADAIAAADADAISRESVKISHLLRRTGFGQTREEHDRYQTLGLEATLDELINFTGVDDSEAERLAGLVDLQPNQRGAPALWWLTRLAHTKRPLQEKMTLFWHGLLTSQISVVRDPMAMVAQNEMYRSYALDAFPNLLRAVTMDSAMMVYLDMDGSVQRAPNENYARELMELFALGVGNYTEEDVREASRAFTGWQVPRNRLEGQNAFLLMEPVFRPGQFDRGVKTFLGRSGNFRPDDIIDIVLEQPASARYVVGRLFAYFVWPEPTDEELEPFIATYNSSGRSIRAVVEAMLRSEEFYSPRAYRAIVKSPLEYAIGAVKALGLRDNIVPLLGQGVGPRGGGVLGEMGQIPFEPPNVAGWPGGINWLNSATIFARINLINRLTGGIAEGRQNRLQQQLAGTDLGTASQAMSYYLPLILDDNIPDAARDVLLEYAGGEQARLSTEELRGLVYLILGSPQFHLS